MKLSTRLSAPSWVVFQLLEECNLRCTMCYQWGENGAHHRRVAPAVLELELVLRTINECLPSRPHFELFGGEPLLYPGLSEVIRAIRRGQCEVDLPSNGTLLEERAVELVAEQPNRLWVSLDGPEASNDRQRGMGVFRRVLRGLEALARAKRASGSYLPELGIALVVTPDNHLHIEDLFLRELDLSQVAALSIELESHTSEAGHREYARVLAEHFGVSSAPCARAYIRSPARFANTDCAAIARQMQHVRSLCSERGIAFFSRPRTLDAANIASYLAGDWQRMADYKNRCAYPWTYAEVSAGGEVSTCHAFYDLTLGNLHEQSLLEIWRGARMQRWRSYLRDRLLPICPSCCRYYH